MPVQKSPEWKCKVSSYLDLMCFLQEQHKSNAWGLYFICPPISVKLLTLRNRTVFLCPMTMSWKVKLQQAGKHDKNEHYNWMMVSGDRYNILRLESNRLTGSKSSTQICIGYCTTCSGIVLIQYSHLVFTAFSALLSIMMLLFWVLALCTFNSRGQCFSRTA
jgi:hypothetical protein